MGALLRVRAILIARHYIDYFRIRKAIDRRIYEIARKHCGYGEEFIVSLEKLHLKVGSTALLKMFRHNIKRLAKMNDLPDYKVIYDTVKDSVVFKNRNFNPITESKANVRTERNKVAEHIKIREAHSKNAAKN